MSSCVSKDPPVSDLNCDLAAMAQTLAESGQYRVLRKLAPRSIINPPDGATTRVGLFVDVETTGLDPDHDEVIELAMLPFTYGADGRIYEVLESFQGFNQPSKPIPPAITQMTAISDEMVAGHRLNLAAMEAMIQTAALVIAHNAGFDRPFAERLSPPLQPSPGPAR
jgi:DNA polymerase-3 subunit epsilon